ncbi:sugar transferase [Raoultella ornithinolytica]|uniref:sugar transferase n=1 Tax=Raoultella ornithinolytica TaxID=54291 RepID=UPI0029CAAC35|nr:sugar transferase [Raoultella ornithinolytica]WPJ13009.1 sugar transferase [Raoultella ornithinolytica]
MNRIYDISLSILMIVILSPLMILIYVSILSSGRKAIFKHRRVGQHGKHFQCFKFTSMINENELNENDLKRVIEEKRVKGKVHNDPRITKIGGFIRRTSLDEIPQLFNVLIGDMSIIGPRPITEDEMKEYGWRVSSYLSIKPGLTGLWQVSGRSNTNYRRRVAIDHYYANHISKQIKLFILLKTIYVVIKMEGAT